MLNLFYGRESIDKEAFLFESLKNTQRAIVIVPDQYTLEAENSIFDTLKDTSSCLMDIEVLSMSRLGHRLISELGGVKRTFIDKYGRHMILSHIARNKGEDLKVFKGLETKESFVSMVNDFISEFKQYEGNSHTLLEIVKNLDEESYLKYKLQDLHLIFSQYEAEIEGKYTDSEDYIDLFLSKIRQSQLLKNNKVWVYGFDSLAPKAMAVLGEIMAVSQEVNVILNCYTDERDNDKELFQLSEVVMANLVRQAEAHEVDFRKIPISADFARKDMAEEIGVIEKNLFALPFEAYKGIEQGKASSVKLIQAANLYNEAETAAAEILRLVRDEGYAFRDIRVVLNDQDVRTNILKRVFKEYEIPLFVNEKVKALQNPINQYVLSFLEAIIGRYKTEAIIANLKTGFSVLNVEEVSRLENYAIKYKIRGTMWKKPFVKGSFEYGENLVHINNLREKAIKGMVDFEGRLKVKTYSEFIDGLYKFLYEEINLPDKIRALAENQSKEREDLAEATKQIWGNLVGILDQIKEIMGDKPFKKNDFLELLKTGLSQVTIGILPSKRDSVVLGTTQRLRTGKAKVLMVLGVNEGVLPRESGQEGLLTEDERELFKFKGSEMCRLDSVMAMEEKMGIYACFSRACEKLYLSYSGSDESGEVLKASGIFERVRELFPDKLVEEDVLNRGDDTLLVNGGISCLRHLTEAIQTYGEEGELSQTWREVFDWYRTKNDEKDRLESIKKGLFFDNSQYKLGKDMAKGLYEKRNGVKEYLTLSPSKVEKFSRCPFSFFVSAGLRPEERRIFQISSREIGDIYHDCLMELSRTLSKNLEGRGIALTDIESPWMTLTKEECDGLVEKIFEGKIANYREGIFLKGKEEQYRSKRALEICRKICWIMVSHVKKGLIVKSRFEVDFGANKMIQPIEIPIDEDGNKILIEGKIDRVDFLRGDRVKIIDYKTGKTSFNKEEVEVGYSLQLMTYLEAAKENIRRPAGVFYFKIKEPRVELNEKLPSDEECLSIISELYKMDGVLVADSDVIRDVAGDFLEKSEVVNVSKLKSGEYAKRGVLMEEEEFAKLEAKTKENLEKICKAIAEGEVKIYPMKSKDKNACEYCEYGSICMFDLGFKGCRYNNF